MTSTLILGGTGKTGRRVVQRFKAAGQPVRAAARTGGDVRLDLDDPATWPPALSGVTAVYLVEPDLNGKARIPDLVAEAAAAGARRLVLLSAPRAGEENHPLHAAEQAVRESGVGWTILRPNWFAQNFSETYWLPGILAGTLALPTGDGRTPFIDAGDIADVAVSALTEDRHSGQVYELTGPRAISFGAATDLIGAATGRTIRHLDVDPGLFVERQAAGGVPPDVARLLTGLFTDIRDGRGAALSDGVERALGRPPTSFEEYAARTAATGVWNVPN